jgi:hypothetical protein
VRDDDDNTDTIIGLSGRPKLVASPNEDTLLGVARPRSPKSVRRAEAGDPARVVHRYRFRVNGEAPSQLDSPVLIGRRPRVSALMGAAAARLIVVPSPSGEVSATHLELHQHGASVIVTDMRSTNGTVVTMPGMPALTLRPGESVVAAPGTLVDIGDGNFVEILPVQRIVSQERDELERRST